MSKLIWFNISGGPMGIKRKVAFSGFANLSIDREIAELRFIVKCFNDDGYEIIHPDITESREIGIGINNSHMVHHLSGMIIHQNHEDYEYAIKQFDFWWPLFISGEFYTLMPQIIQMLDNLTDENGNSYSRFNIK